MNSESYFDGGILGYIGYSILGAIICVFTLGIGTPWAVCMMQNWKTKHTVIDGKRLYLMVLGHSCSVTGSSGFF